MKQLEIEEFGINLARLIDEVRTNHSEIVITRNGKPIARILPCESTSLAEHNYPLRGMPITFSKDFDEPMPELWEALEQ